MLIECFGHAASGKSTITRKLKRCYHDGGSPIPKGKQELSEESQAFMEAYARLLGRRLRFDADYNDHRKLMKRMRQRLELYEWATWHNQPHFTSMGILQAVLDMFMLASDPTYIRGVPKLLDLMPKPAQIIRVHCGDLNVAVDRHIKRTKASPKEQQLYMTTDRYIIHDYITSQADISRFLLRKNRLNGIILHINNDYATTKELFASAQWQCLMEGINKVVCQNLSS